MMQRFDRVRRSVGLLLERRSVIILCVDALWLFIGVIQVLMGSGRASDIYFMLVLGPYLVLGVPLLAECVVVERRSGTLDLVLASPGSRFYFERRVAGFALLMFLQGVAVILFARFGIEAFPLSGAIVQTATICVFLAVVTLYWTLRLRTAGGAGFAAVLTAFCLAPWFFSNPIHIYTPEAGAMTAEQIVDWFKQNLVLLSAAGVFYLYALRRLARPEIIIT